MHTRLLLVLALLSGIASSLMLPLAVSAAPLPAIEPCTPSGQVAGDSVESASDLPPVTDPTVSVSPISGPSGTTATRHLTHFVANLPVRAIFRTIGDPVVATGTTDATGGLYLDFTVPQAPNGSYYILVQGVERTCVHAATVFQIAPLTPTPVPTSTPIATPTRVVTATPTAPSTAVPATPTAMAPTQAPATPTVVRPTPVAPLAGSGPGGSGTSFGLDFSVIALGIMLVGAGFGLLGNVQRRTLATARWRAGYREFTNWPGVPRQRTHTPDAAGQGLDQERLVDRMRGQR
jgi:hypothetical protein